MTQWTLPGAPDSVGLARRLVAEAAPTHPRVEDAVLVTSELVTNAVKHGTGAVRVTATHTEGTLRICVTADSESDPTPHTAAPTDAGGRGLAIVSALATTWGWQRDGDAVHVWAQFTGA